MYIDFSIRHMHVKIIVSNRWLLDYWEWVQSVGRSRYQNNTIAAEATAAANRALLCHNWLHRHLAVCVLCIVLFSRKYDCWYICRLCIVKFILLLKQGKCMCSNNCLWFLNDCFLFWFTLLWCMLLCIAWYWGSVPSLKLPF